MINVAESMVLTKVVAIIRIIAVQQAEAETGNEFSFCLCGSDCTLHE